MLDVIRSNAQSWGVKIAFGIIILVFVFWGVGGLTGGPSTVILTVNGEPITIQEFQRKYEQLEQQVRAQYPDIDAAGLKAMQLKQQLIQNLVLENILIQEAKRVGATVTPVELRKVVESFPAFQNAEGKFDPDAYLRMLKAQRNSPGNFEAELRNNMLINKLRTDVTAGAFVPEAEVRDLFRYEGDRRILEYVLYPVGDFPSTVAVADAQIKDYYDANQAASTVPPQADVEYLLIGAEALAASQVVSDAAVADFYQKNAAQFATPEVAHARHILVRVDEKASAEDQAKAEARLEAVAGRLPGVPLVLHGASSVPQEAVAAVNAYGGKVTGASGVPESLLRRAAASAICKINIDTDLRLAVTAAIRISLREHPEAFDPRAYLSAGRDAVRAMVRHKIRDVLGSSGRA